MGISNSGTPQTPSIVATTDRGQVSTVGPSASLVTDSVQGKPTAKLRSHTEFTISHYQQPNSWQTQEKKGPKRLTYEEAVGLIPTSSQAPVAVLPDQPVLNNTQGEVPVELMRMPDTNRFLGVYPDLRLPIPGNPCISQVFFNNTKVRSRDDNPMTLVMVLGMTC